MNTALKGGWGSASRPGRSLPPGKTRYPLYRRVGGPQGRFGQMWENLTPTGIRSPDHPARSQSLYRLSYTVHMFGMLLFNFVNWVSFFCCHVYVFLFLCTFGSVYSDSLCCSMYCFMCKYVLYYCHRVSTQLQLTKYSISYLRMGVQNLLHLI
jgi:hypothetical protein